VTREAAIRATESSDACKGATEADLSTDIESLDIAVEISLWYPPSWISMLFIASESFCLVEWTSESLFSMDLIYTYLGLI